MSNCIISFCLPVYNVERYLDECLNSIDKQKITGEYEILCIDDCSTDGSYAKLLELSETIPNVRILKNEINSGVSFTRNRCLRNAIGKYIWFVDPDDMLYPGCVNLVLEAAEDNNAEIVLGNYIIILEDNQIEYEPLSHITACESEKYLPEDEKGIGMCYVWGGVFRKDFLIGKGLFFNEKMIAQEDTLFYYEFSLYAKRVFKFSEPCYLYRQRFSSVMHSRSKQRAYKYYFSMREMYRVYLKHWDDKTYRDKNEILDKLMHMRQNLAWTLAEINDTSFVRKELKRLKQDKFYPYPYTKKYTALMPICQKILTVLLPCELDFWVVHYLSKVRSWFIMPADNTSVNA